MKRFLSVFAALMACASTFGPAAAFDTAHVDSLEVEDQVIRAVWAAFVDRLNAGDALGAIEYHVPESRESVSKLYDILGDRLKDLPDNWTELLEPEMHGPFVSYEIRNRSTRKISRVTFLKFPDGQWLIHSM